MGRPARTRSPRRAQAPGPRLPVQGFGAPPEAAKSAAKAKAADDDGGVACRLQGSAQRAGCQAMRRPRQVTNRRRKMKIWPLIVSLALISGASAQTPYA